MYDNILDWIMQDFLPIFIDSQTLANFTWNGWSIREILAFWLVSAMFWMPTLAIYFHIKKGRRLF